MDTKNNTSTVSATASQSDDTIRLSPEAGVKAANQDLLKILLVAVPLAAVCLLFTGIAGGAYLLLRGDDSASEVTSTDPAEAAVLEAKVDQIEAGSPAEEPSLAAGSEGDVSTTGSNQAPAVDPAAGVATASPVSVPEICRQTGLISEPALTRPVFSPISFATRQGPDGWPLDPGVQFTEAISQVQASFGYAGMENGLTWERAWYFWDKELVRGSGVWDAGERGQLTVHTQVAEQGFVPGRYRLELYVEGQLLSQNTFTLVSTDTRTTRSVQIAYTDREEGRHQINLFDLENETSETLVANARYPAWSPNGVGLLFYGQEGIAGGTAGLWVFNMNQAQAYQLNEETNFETIAWSPQRSYMATVVDQPQGPQLELWPLDRDEVIAGPAGEDPTWSPEGRRLAYRGCDQDGWSIRTVNVISGVIDLDSVRVVAEGDVSRPAWSPDGQRLAFVRGEGPNQDIFSVAAGGSDLMRLTEQPGPDTAPVWTPDGRLLFWAWRDDAWGLHLMDANGSSQRQLLASNTSADWSPERPAVGPAVRLVEPTPPPPPKPQVYVPPGRGILVVSNLKNNDEMTFTIDNTEHKVGPYRYKTIPLSPGNYTWTASWPGKTSRTGIANVALGQAAYPVVER